MKIVKKKLIVKFFSNKLQANKLNPNLNFEEKSQFIDKKKKKKKNTIEFNLYLKFFWASFFK